MTAKNYRQRVGNWAGIGGKKSGNIGIDGGPFLGLILKVRQAVATMKKDLRIERKSVTEA